MPQYSYPYNNNSNGFNDNSKLYMLADQSIIFLIFFLILHRAGFLQPQQQWPCSTTKYELYELQ